MRKIKGITLVLVLLLIMALTIACQPRETPPTENPPEQNPQTETPNLGDETYEDGTYNAEGETDERGWKATIEVTVENGKITEAKFDEVKEDGTLKSQDEAYIERWSSATGAKAPEVYAQLEEDLIEKQNPEDVETITGATQATEKFKTLAAEALKQQ